MPKLSTIPDPEFLANPTPGQILLEHFLKPLPLRQTALAGKLVLGKRAITAEPGVFLGLQAGYGLMARRRELGGDLELIEPRAA
jgi:antitoxin HigA-1